MIPALPWLVSTPASSCLSIRMTSRPRCCRCSAAPTPTMPAPRTSTSALSSVISTPKVEYWGRLRAAYTELIIAAHPRKPKRCACAALRFWQHGSNVSGAIAAIARAISGERSLMSVRHTLLAATIAAIAALSISPASSQVLRYANQGELKSLDPYTLKETTTIAHHAHVYEGLVTRDKNLKTAPALAESWETLTPTHWRFHLRKGVKFHNGDPFTADDVLFSAQRVRANGSNFLSNVPPDAKFVKVDDYTVDVMLDAPNPILISQWDGWYIMDKKWCEEHDTAAPTPASATTPSYASLHENGTGPFTIESHQPGGKTLFKVNTKSWGKPEQQIKEIDFTSIGTDAPRVAALLSGEVDVIEPVPLQDIARVNASGNATVMNGPE